MISLALIASLAIPTPGLTDDRTTNAECRAAYEALWDWDVDDATLDDFSARISPPPEQPSLDACVAADVRWQPWTRYDNLVKLFDTMRTWKRCASQLDGYATWEQCRADDRRLCTNSEFERRLTEFGISGPGQCEDILPVCDQLTEVEIEGQSECWMHYRKIQQKCGRDRVEAWKRGSCGHYVDSCEAARSQFAEAPLGECREPYERMSEVCPDRVIYEFDLDGNACMASLRQTDSEACHRAALAYQEAAGEDACGAAAKQVRRWCADVPDWEALDPIRSTSACRQVCEDAIAQISTRAFCRPPRAGLEACVSSAQHDQLIDHQTSCADRNSYVGRRVLPTALGLGGLGFGLTAGAFVAEFYDRDRTAIILGIIAAASGLVSLSLGGTAIGLFNPRRPGGAARTAGVVLDLVTGRPVRF